MAEQNAPLQSRLSAARTEAFEQAESINFLKTLVIVFVAAILVVLLISALNYIAGQTRARAPFDNKEARNRIVELEKELTLLKSDLAVVQQPNSIWGSIKPALAVAAANWALISFLAAVLTAFYIKVNYKITYFESYRDLAAKKALSEFYRALGDRMMIPAQWKAAAAAYQAALDINPTNMLATYGMAQTSVFLPLKGKKRYDPELADAKLDYLMLHSIKKGTKKERMRDAAQLYFLKSVNRRNIGDYDEEKECLNKSIKADPGFVAPHVNLGILHENRGDIDQALECYKKAVELEPKFALPNNNLGSTYLVSADFAKAIEYLQYAANIFPTLLTHVSLGEAYAYNGDFDRALELHERAVKTLEEPGIAKEDYVRYGGNWTYGFMPLEKGDKETIKKVVRVRDFEQKSYVTFAALAFDYALLEKLQEANKQFARAWLPEKWDDCSKLFLNRIQSTLKLILNISPITREWFESKANELEASAE
jgi:tetratricopeptide (TPR) repeat protein